MKWRGRIRRAVSLLVAAAVLATIWACADLSVSMALPAPPNLQATDGAYQDRVEITWDPTTARSNEVITFDVYRCVTADGAYTEIGSADTHSFADTDAIEGFSYFYRARARSDIRGVSAASDSDRGHRGLGTPTNVLATDGDYDDRVVVSWDAVNQAVSYTVYRSMTGNGDYESIGDSEALSLDDYAAEQGVIYHYRVSAVSEDGTESALSGSDEGYRAAIAGPTGLEAADGESYDFVRVTWDENADAEEYQLCRAADDEESHLPIGTTRTTEFEDLTCLPGVRYTYRVHSSSEATGLSLPSEPDEGFRTAIGVPAGLDAHYDTPTCDHVELTWTAAAGAESYVVGRSTSADGEPEAYFQAAETMYFDTTGFPGDTYYYQVRSYRASQSEGVPSEPVIGTRSAQSYSVVVLAPFPLTIGPPGTPYSLDLDEDWLYVSTHSGAEVQKWDAADGTQETGNWPHEEPGPDALGLALNLDGGFLYALYNDGATHLVHKLNASSGNEQGGDWPLTGFDAPQDLAVGPGGTIYVSDGSVIRRYSTDDGSDLGQIEVGDECGGIAADTAGIIYVSLTSCDEIVKLDAEGQELLRWGEHGADWGQFDGPHGIGVDDEGYVYVADRYNHRVQKFSAQGAYITEWGGSGTADGRFNQPIDVVIGSDGSVYVTDSGNARIQKFALDPD